MTHMGHVFTYPTSHNMSRKPRVYPLISHMSNWQAGTHKPDICTISVHIRIYTNIWYPEYSTPQNGHPRTNQDDSDATPTTRFLRQVVSHTRKCFSFYVGKFLKSRVFSHA